MSTLPNQISLAERLYRYDRPHLSHAGSGFCGMSMEQFKGFEDAGCIAMATFGVEHVKIVRKYPLRSRNLPGWSQSIPD
ncbi:MAG: hypothetical protein SFW09_14975 [Hyphomicrobiaceae bacterium]|nr:hypothetical protein [Hyphomicrobiaceae bacterium]